MKEEHNCEDFIIDEGAYQVDAAGRRHQLDEIESDNVGEITYKIKWPNKPVYPKTDGFSWSDSWIETHWCHICKKEFEFYNGI